ncbi:hypothetical protein KKI19_00610 [Patescibacteria group bacterium]|nr:hypothetical protein [Patescibacteria group bacterium]
MSAHLNFFGHEIIHLVLTALVAIFLFWRFRDFRLIFASFVFGIFIDVDHWFDYFSYFGLGVNLSNFFDVGSYMEPAGKIYVLLHGWEFVILSWLLGKGIGRKLKIDGLEWAISLSYLGHLLWDSFAVPAPFWAYSFIYRLLSNFSLEGFNGI